MTGIDTTVVGSRSGAMAAACWAVVQMMGYDGFQKMVLHCMTTAERLRHALEDLPEVDLLRPAPVNLVALRLLDKASSAPKTREMLGRHRIYPDWLSRRASDCPEEIFPIYLMPHVTTDDVDRFVADLVTTFR
jgi:tyrosine decarboxylase/aspartate 1-decarboxylase